MMESSEPEKVEKPATQPPVGQADPGEELELKLPGESSAPRDLALWAGVLALLTFIVFWPATDGSFLWRDDRVPTSRQFVGPGSLPRIWSQRWSLPAEYGQAMYQPVAFTAYWLEYQLGGHNAQGIPTPMAYHIASVVFLAASAVLLWLTLRELKIHGAWLIAALFALHPVHAEPVSWISEQPIVLAGLFFIASIYLYLLFVQWLDRDLAQRSAGQPGVDPAQTWGLFAASVLLALMAMLSHPSATVLPAIILLILWWQKRVTRFHLLALLLTLAVGAIVWSRNIELAAGGLVKAGGLSQVAWWGRAMGLSLTHLIWPFRFSILYPASGSVLGLLGATLALLVIEILYLLRGWLGRGLFVGAAAFVLLAAGGINWFDASRLSNLTDGSVSMAVVPLLILIVAFAVERFGNSNSKGPQAVVGISAVVLIAVAIPAWLHSYSFETPVSLWRDTLKKHPGMVLAEASLAEQLRLLALADTADGDKDKMDADLNEAIEHAQSALQIDANSADAQRTWANVLVAKGDDSAALPHFLAAINSDPTNARLRAEYGTALLTLGRNEDARTQLDESLEQDPSSGITHRLLGKAYFGLKNYPRAATEAQLALEIDQTDSAAWELLAQAQTETGNLKDALVSYGKLGVIDPSQLKRAGIFVAMSNINDRQGDFDNAVQFLELAHQVAPDDHSVTKQLAIEIDKQHRAAATRPSTRSTSGPATTQTGP